MAIRSGRAGGLGRGPGRGQVGQPLHSARDIMQAGLGIDADRQARGRMPGQGLTGLDRRARRHEGRDVGSTEGVKVDHPGRGRDPLRPDVEVERVAATTLAVDDEPVQVGVEE